MITLPEIKSGFKMKWLAILSRLECFVYGHKDLSEKKIETKFFRASRFCGIEHREIQVCNQCGKKIACCDWGEVMPKPPPPKSPPSPKPIAKELRVSIPLTPCIKYSKGTKLEQCHKIRDEIQEVIEAVEAENDEAAIEELFDVMTGCATCLVCQFGLSKDQILKWADQVHDKNKRRGYHEGGEESESNI